MKSKESKKKMTLREKAEILENLNEKIPKLSDEQRGFLLGFMEGITQAAEMESE